MAVQEKQTLKSRFFRGFKKILKISFYLTVCVVLIISMVAHIPQLQCGLFNYIFTAKSADLGWRLHTETLRFNLFTGSISASNLFMAPESMDSPARINIGNLSANLSILDLLQEALVLENIEISSPVFTAQREPDGTFTWPWSSTTNNEVSETDLTPRNTSTPKILIKNASLTNGTFQINNASSELKMVTAAGLALQVSMDFAARELDAILTIPSAKYELESNDLALTLTEPLKMILQRAGGPLTIDSSTTINQFPITLTGHVTPEASPISYSLKLHGHGPIHAFLAPLNLTDLEIPGLTLDVVADSTENALPNLTVQAVSADINISRHTVKHASLDASFDGKKVVSDIDLQTGTGSLNLNLEIPDIDTDTPWLQRLTAKNFPLETINPCLPKTLDLRGVLNGYVKATGTPDTWKDAVATCELHLSQRKSTNGRSDAPMQRKTPQTTPETKQKPVTTLTPVGSIELKLDKEILTAKQIKLIDPVHQINGSGSWNIKNSTWNGKLDLNTADIATWATLANKSATGAVRFDGMVSGSHNAKGLQTLLGKGQLTLNRVVVADQNPISGTLDVTVNERQFQASLPEISYGDVLIKGAASGDILPNKRGTQTIESMLDSVVVRDNPTRAFQLRWQRTSTQQTASIHTDTSDLDATLTQLNQPDAPWQGTVNLNHFRIDPLAAFLPTPWDTMTGALDGNITLDGPTITAAIRSMTLNILEHSISCSNPFRVGYNANELTISNLVLLSDDNARLAANGRLPFHGNSETQLQMELVFPELADWRFPGLDTKLSGAVSSQIALSGYWPKLIPGGTISGTGLKMESLSIGGVELRTAGTGSADALNVAVLVDEMQMGNSGPIVTTEGIVTISEWLETSSAPVAAVVISRLNSRWNKLKYSAKVPTEFTFRNGLLTVPSLKLTGPEFELSASGTLPLTNSPDKTDASMLLSVVLNAELKPFSSLGADIGDLDGQIKSDLAIAGTLAEPLITGYITLVDIMWDNPKLPGPIKKLKGSLSLAESAVTLQETSFDFAGGPMMLSGGFTRQGMTPETFDLKLKAREIDLDYTSDLQLQGRADFWFRGRWPEVKAGGTLRIDEALYSPEFDLIDLLMSLPEQKLIIADNLNDGKEPEDESIEADKGFPLEISIIAHEGVRVENPHMHLDLAGRLQVTGTTALPGLLGSITFNQGYIDLLLHEFEITSGAVNFSDPYDLNPGLDIQATTPVADDVVTLQITGYANKPNLLLSSETGKSHAEIMDMLLGNNSPGGGNDLATMARDYAKQAAAMAAARAISARTNLIVVPFPESLEGEDLLFGVGRKFGKRWTVMYYIGEKSDEGDVIEVNLEVNPKADLRFRQNQDGTLSGGLRYRETFN